MHLKTANKKLSALRQYWSWLEKIFGVKSNPWMRKSLPKTKAHRIAPDRPMGPERPFTDDEVRILLAGPADTDMTNTMRISALSGMRLDKIGQLRIGDCRDDTFSVTRSKSAAGVRTIPMHSARRPMIAQLVANAIQRPICFSTFRTPVGMAIGQWPSRSGLPNTARNLMSMTRDPVRDDPKSTSTVLDVGLRPKAEDAGHRENVLANIMGHESEVGITFGLYSNAQLKRLKKAYVESVKLPG